MTHTSYFQILHTIYVFSGTGSRCDSVTISQRLDSSPQLIERGMLHLENRGLLDRKRVRLTLRGLSVAAAISSNRELLANAGTTNRRAA